MGGGGGGSSSRSYFLYGSWLYTGTLGPPCPSGTALSLFPIDTENPRVFF